MGSRNDDSKTNKLSKKKQIGMILDMIRIIIKDIQVLQLFFPKKSGSQFGTVVSIIWVIRRKKLWRYLYMKTKISDDGSGLEGSD